MRERLTYANVMSTIAVFLALGLGGAYAADKITSKDIAKSAVTSKAIKNKAVKGKDVKDATLRSADYGDGSVAAVDLVANPPVAPLVLGNGGEGDCIWTDVTADFPGSAPVSARRDAFGEVALSGATGPVPGSGGDGMCDGGGAESLEDSTVTTLPPDYRPALSQSFVNSSSGGVILVAGVNGLTLGTSNLAPGGVFSAVSSPAFLNEISFLAADAPNAPAPASGPDRISRSVLRSYAR